MQAFTDYKTKPNSAAGWVWVIEVQTDAKTWKIVNAAESELDAELTYHAEKARFANRRLRIRKTESLPAQS